jgi:hypothetical protein
MADESHVFSPNSTSCEEKFAMVDLSNAHTSLL